MAVSKSDRQIAKTRYDDDQRRDFRSNEVRVAGRGMHISSDEDADDDTGGLSGTVDEDRETGGARSTIGTVRDIRVEKEVVKQQPDGTSVVDVTFTFEEARGAANHEVRISKA